VYVSPHHRRRDIGRILAKEPERYSIELGISLYLWASRRRFFEEKCGIRAVFWG